MRHLVLRVITLALTACGNVESSYATLEAARGDRLFERGWLPDVLPPSAREIRVSADLDINTATGGFTFDNADAAAFFSRLTPGADRSVWSGEWQNFAKALGDRYRSYTFVQGQSKWLFWCTDGSSGCQDCLWVMRDDG